MTSQAKLLKTHAILVEIETMYLNLLTTTMHASILITSMTTRQKMHPFPLLKKKHDQNAVPFDDVHVTDSLDELPNDHLILDLQRDSNVVEICAVDSGIEPDSTNAASVFKRITNSEIPFSFMRGKRVNSKLLYSPDEVQFYVKNATSKIGEGWTCYENACTARVHVKKDK